MTLADKIMVTRQAVSRWEHGDTVPNTDTLKLLSKEFNVSINTLLGEPRKLICQCCGMPIDDDSILGRDKDGTINEEYCKWCYADGTYTYNDMDELIDVCVKNMVNESFTEEQARTYLKEMLASVYKAGCEEHTNSRANLWSDGQKSYMRLCMRVRLHSKSKPSNYTESCMINKADGWRGRNVWYLGRSVRYALREVTIAYSNAERTEVSRGHSSREVKDRISRRLEYDREKSRTVSVFAIRNFKFLGFALGRNGKGIYVRVHPKSWKKFKSRLKELSSRKRCQSIKPSLGKIKVYARGWLNYYGIASMKNNIDDINGWLYHRIRMCIWKQWKKPRTKARNLIKMGVPEDLAMQAGNTRRGHWFATHTVAVNMAMTKERLINSGFYDLATVYQSVHVNY